MHFDESLSEIVSSQQETNGVRILPIELKHIWQLNNLPMFHKDPFDRILISQVISENMPIISIRHLQKYHNPRYT